MTPRKFSRLLLVKVKKPICNSPTSAATLQQMPLQSESSL